ncbi:MAG: sulfotransferase domain-containing protein [Bacteroidota bacterium]
MAENRKIIWLASYPKSGNTWFRVFLTNLLDKNEKPANINNLYPTTIASSRQMFDEATGLSSSDLSPSEIETLRPEVYRYIAETSENTIYHKIHDANILTGTGKELVPPDVTFGALYFIRNPLDVCVSFAHHAATDFQTMSRRMNNPEHSFCNKPEKLHNQLEQRLLTWSDHVKSWTDQDKFPVQVVRFEDMLENPVETFTKAVRFAGLKNDKKKIKKALEFSSFEELKKQENKSGFLEKAPGASSFFREGKTGTWKKLLPPKVVKEIVDANREIMIRYGYLDDQGEICT